jgi:hypothetical protein
LFHKQQRSLLTPPIENQQHSLVRKIKNKKQEQKQKKRMRKQK